MLSRASVLLLSACGCVSAQIGLPRAGCFADPGGRLRSVFGLAGNFVIGQPERDGVLAAACSNRFAVLKLADSIEVRRGADLLYRHGAPGPALLALSPRGDAALAYLHESSELLILTAAGATPLQPPEGEVLALAWPEPRRILTVSRAEAESPVLLRPDGTFVYARDREVVLGDAVAPLPGRAAALENLGERFVRVILADGAGHVVLELRDGVWVVWRLPEVEP